MAEWSIALVLKTRERKFRGFESHSFRVVQYEWRNGRRGGVTTIMAGQWVKPLEK